ncbi:hypothetical protein GCM10020331_029540 [Ectobacillus funiculus]
MLLAVGGGSVIDCTKAIAVGAKYEGNVWDIITRKVAANGALPFGTVLTLAATGSEMNSGSVITNWETNEKNMDGAVHLPFRGFSIFGSCIYIHCAAGSNGLWYGRYYVTCYRTIFPSGNQYPSSGSLL